MATVATQAKKDLIASAIGEVRRFRFCGPSDDPDEQTAVTVGFRHLIVQLKRLAGPLLPEDAASRLSAINVEVDNLYSAYDAKAELDALLPDIEGVLEPATETTEGQTKGSAAKPLPIPLCSIVGDVLGTFIYQHRALDALFYGAGAVGEVPQGNCVTKCQTWLKRMNTDVANPTAVLGKLLEEFMEVDLPFKEGEQQTGRRKVTEILGRFGLSYHRGGLILGAATALPTRSLTQVLQDRDLTAVDKEFERALANIESDPPAAITAAGGIFVGWAPPKPPPRRPP
jgi:hypothetical protein